MDGYIAYFIGGPLDLSKQRRSGQPEILIPCSVLPRIPIPTMLESVPNTVECKMVTYQMTARSAFEDDVFIYEAKPQ